jgi:hypothetical protein
MRHDLAKHLGRVLHQICGHVCCWLKDLLALTDCPAWEGGAALWGLEAAQGVMGQVLHRVRPATMGTVAPFLQVHLETAFAPDQLAGLLKVV